MAARPSSESRTPPSAPAVARPAPPRRSGGATGPRTTATRGGAGKSPSTLAIDVGGTGIKASVLDMSGHMEHDRVRINTPYPLSPQKLVLEIQKMTGDLPQFDRVSLGFPGMVRAGRILSAPHFLSPDGPGGRPEPKLVKAWQGFDLAEALHEVTGKPSKVANDADIQGAAVVQGTGFELVITLGTGVGTAFFMDGRLLPHLEFSHHPLSKGRNYNEVLGDDAAPTGRRQEVEQEGTRGHRDAVELGDVRPLLYRRGQRGALAGDLPENVTIVSNDAGILGGIKLWDVTSPEGPPTAARLRTRRSHAPRRRRSHRPEG